MRNLREGVDMGTVSTTLSDLCIAAANLSSQYMGIYTWVHQERVTCLG